MKVYRLKRADINAEEWDQFISRTPQNNVYAKSWFLDIIPQNWEAYIIRDDEGNLTATLPFQIKKKFGLKKIQQDAFTNELGIFHLPGKEAVSQNLLTAFKKLTFISIYKFNHHNLITDLQSLPFESTHHLSLKQPYEQIEKGFHQNLKRNILKAKKANVVIYENQDIEGLINLFKQNVAFKINAIEEYQYDLLRKIFQELLQRELVSIYQAHTPEGELLSAGMIVKSGNYLIYYFAASSDKGKQLNSQSYLISEVIRANCESDLTFDFEGGNTKGLGRYYESFGSVHVRIPYLRKMAGSSFLKLFKLKVNLD